MCTYPETISEDKKVPSCLSEHDGTGIAVRVTLVIERGNVVEFRTF